MPPSLNVLNVCLEDVARPRALLIDTRHCPSGVDVVSVESCIDRGIAQTGLSQAEALADIGAVKAIHFKFGRTRSAMAASLSRGGMPVGRRVSIT